MKPTPAFVARLDQTLQRYRTAAATRVADRCRLVQYCGVDRPYGLDIDTSRIEYEISFHLAEGLLVDWHFADQVFYLCTQEPGCPMPMWDQVKAEQAMADVDALLKDAGFGG